MELKKELEYLASKFFDDDEVLKVTQQLGLGSILRSYLDDDKLSEYSHMQSLLTKISQHPTLYQQLLFQTEQSTIQEMLVSSEVLVRQLVVLTIYRHSQQIYSILLGLQQNQRPVFLMYVDVLFYQIKDPETSVAQKAQASLLAFATQEKDNQKYPLLSDPHYQQKLLEILDDDSRENSESALRCIDLVVDISNLDEKSQKLMVDSGCLDLAVGFLKTDDLLLKLGVVEVISKLGDTYSNQHYLKEGKLLQQVQDEAFHPQTDFYVSKYLVLLLAKMLNANILDFSKQFQQQLISFLKPLLDSQQQEVKEGIFNILSVLFQSKKLLEFLSKQPIVMQLFLMNAFNTVSVVKNKFLSTFSQILFQQREDQQKEAGILKNLFYCLGNQHNIHSYSPMNQLTDTQGVSLKYLITLLTIPFEDYELEALKILSNLICFEFGIKEIMREPEIINYLVKGFAKNKEIFDLKRDINDHLAVVTEQLAKKDPVVEGFRKEYIKQMQEAKGQNKQVYVQTQAK